GAVLIALVAGLVGGGFGFYLAERPGAASGVNETVDLAVPPKGSTERPDDSFAGIANRVLPSVVSIRVRGADAQGTGSGFVIHSDGYVLTNNHVVGPAVGGGEIRVQFQDGGQLHPAEIVGRDSSYDLAVLKVDGAEGVDALPLGNSESVVVGDPVMAIGSPLGLSGTVTSGIISATDRPVTAGQGGGDASYISAVQTDAAINPGNSGGPLVNAQGQVIGVNTAIATLSTNGLFGGQQGGNIGLGFAIPINQAERVAEQLIKTGEAVHPIIGATLDPTFKDRGARILPESVRGHQPLLPGGPAEQAGLQPGDVIVAADGERVADGSELIVAIRSKAPGDEITLAYVRDGQERTVTLTLAKSTEP
ncbi:MAG: S1C family serine protease, partial [Carbonactinosporaceae bacterium]